MTLLEKLLDEVKIPNSTEREEIWEVCRKVESDSPTKYPDIAPVGPRIMLTLDVPGRNQNEIGFVTLEFEGTELYLATYYVKDTRREDSTLKRVRVFEIEEFKPKKVLNKFFQIVKSLKGKI